MKIAEALACCPSRVSADRKVARLLLQLENLAMTSWLETRASDRWTHPVMRVLNRSSSRALCGRKKLKHVVVSR